MHEGLAQYLNEKRIEGSLADQCARLAADDAAALEALLTELSPSANTVRSYLQLATEIAQRDGVRVAQVLGSPEIAAPAFGSGSKKERQRRVRQQLMRLRYPEINRLHEEVERCTKTLRKELGLRVEVPEDLEGDSVTVTLHGRSAEEFIELGRRVSALGENPSLRELFSILRGEA